MLKQKWFKILFLMLFSGAVSTATSSTLVFDAENSPDILRAVDFAREHQKTIMIQDVAHNDSFQDSNAVYLNLQNFNDMITLQLKKKTMLVESGMTWNEAQQLAAPFGLSLKFIPADVNEPIVETINYNQTGLSPQNPLVADGIASMRVLQPDGQIVAISADKTPELWRGVFGAQGVLGVVLDVQLKLVTNRNLVRQTERLSFEDYTTYLRNQIRDNPDVSASFARINIAPGKNFLNDLYAVSYWVKDGELAAAPQPHPVREHIAQSVYHWSEKGDGAKRLRWQLELALLANTALCPGLTRADLSLRQGRATEEDQSPQVYYIPVARFVSFMDDFRAIALAQKWSFNEISLHYLAEPNDLLLAPQQGDTIAINVSVSKTALAQQKAMIPVLMDLALNHAGSFALDQWTTQDMAKVKSAYPQWGEFQKLTAPYVGNNLFASAFYPAAAAS